MKFLLLGVIGYIVVMWVMRTRQNPRKPGVGARKSADLPEGGGTEEMIRCAHCGIYILSSEAVVSQAGKTFCGDEHRKQHISG